MWWYMIPAVPTRHRHSHHEDGNILGLEPLKKKVRVDVTEEGDEEMKDKIRRELVCVSQAKSTFPPAEKRQTRASLSV